MLLCFNLLGEGFEVALPRIIDTLIGCAIAWAAVSFIWPDWKFRNLPRVLDRAMNANCPGDGAADQRINDTRQRDFKALAKQVKAQQHQQRNKHRGMGVLHVTEGKKQHAGQDDQQRC